MALGLEDVHVGTWTAPSGISGCTVILPPEGTLGALAVRGAAPGTREAAALGVHGKLEVCHGVVLAGGSAYGLGAADGVVRWLEERGRGYPVVGALVPIVGAAIVLDGSVADPPSRPGAEAGAAACEAAGTDDPHEGAVGVGAGCTVAKVAGIEHAWRGGQGVAVRRAGDLVVGVVVGNNAVGEVRGDDGSWIARARVADDAPRYPQHPQALARPAAPGGSDADAGGPTQNTVIGAIVTNARLTKRQAHRVADLGHTGIARAVWPAHTEMDGDALFCLATGRVEANVDAVADLAASAVAEATRRGPRLAVGGGGFPGLADAAEPASDGPERPAR